LKWADLDARDLRLLPRGQRRVELGERFGGLRFESDDFFVIAGESPLVVKARNSSSRASMSATGVSKLK